MRSRLFMAALATTLVAAPAMVSAAASTTTESSESATAKIKATKYRMLLTFDHMGPLVAGARVRDMSRHRNSGVVMVLAPGRVTKAKGIHGTGANFPNRGRAVIEAKDKIGLDPGARLFTFGAAVRLTKGQGVVGSNVMQKGYFNTPGGQFKLQLEPGGVPACVFFGATSRVKVTSAVGIANNKWHRVACIARQDRGGGSGRRQAARLPGRPDRDHPQRVTDSDRRQEAQASEQAVPWRGRQRLPDGSCRPSSRVATKSVADGASWRLR